MTSPSPLRRPDRVALGIAVFLAVSGIVILADMGRLADVAGYSQVGPATVPRWVAIGLLILSALTAISAFRGKLPSEPVHAPFGVLWIIVGLGAQIALLKTAGFSIATAVMFACVARGFDERRWYISFPAGLLISFVVFAIFSQLLRLSLPAGWLERMIF